MPDPISWALSWPYYLIALGIGYLFGSVPFGVLLTRFFGSQDVREIGSGNIGATNVLRTGRKDLAALTLLGDAVKAVAAIQLVTAFWGDGMATTAAFGAFVGHLFPLWLRFKGGKGVATLIGILFGLYWPAGFAFLGLWLAIALLTRYSSLAALLASLGTTLLLFFVFDFARVAEVSTLLTVLLWIKHHSNIRLLLAGSESRIGETS